MKLFVWLARLWQQPRPSPNQSRPAASGTATETIAFDHAAHAAALAEVQREAAARIQEAKAEASDLRLCALAEEEAQRQSMAELADRLEDRQQRLDSRIKALDERSEHLSKTAQRLQTIETDIDNLRERRIAALQQQAGVSVAEASAEVMNNVERELREDVERRLRAHEAQATAEADTRARAVVSSAVQRLKPPVVPDPSVDPLHTASADVRQKLAGRGAHTLRAVEEATGCELSVEEVPGDAPNITLAGFDPIRREVARTALTWLIRDGSMNPARVEQVIQRAQREVTASIERAGAIAAAEAACQDLPSEVVHTLGRLRYRTSYGQNQLQHAIETSHIAAMLAHELGADVYTLRHGALLHDLGKAIDRENEGTHAMLGADICQRNGMSEDIVLCIAAHHEEIEPSSIEAKLTIVADAISGGRPGARRESLERYLSRLNALEEVAHSFPGVERAFAIQAGREVRILVRSEQVDDAAAAQLAKDVSQTIQEKLEYPGQIRVTVLRETRAVDYAR